MRELIERLLVGERWKKDEAARFMAEVMTGRVAPEVLACALGALRCRGETPCEVAGFAEATRAAAVPVRCAGAVYDIVGTGGDGAGTFNISTAAALIGAAAGVPVAKHGNRAISSRSGSADVLEALGVPTDLGPDDAAAAIGRHGFAFLLAPRYHPGFAHAAPVRRALGVRTVFNLLGPLVNPAGPAAAVIGVFAPSLGRLVAEALVEGGVARALVVHGDGTDEIALSGETQAWEVEAGEVRERTLLPEDAGLARAPREALRGGAPAENAALLARLLRGEEDGPRLDAALLNAAALLWVSGRAEGLRAGVATARAAIASGAGAALLDALRGRAPKSCC